MTGRADDMIVSGGENVFPAEVEAALLAHAGIADAGVVGVADGDFGARLVAYVVAAPGVGLDDSTVQRFVSEDLARHKVPREVIFIKEIPRNPAGKVLRSALRDLDQA